MRYFATLSTAVDSEAGRSCVTTTDPFSIMEKSDESQFFENMTILFRNKEDVTVDKTDEVEDQKVSPQFRFIC